MPERTDKATVGIDITSSPSYPKETKTFVTKITGTYTPGYFSFYEEPVLIEAINWLQQHAVYP